MIQKIKYILVFVVFVVLNSSCATIFGGKNNILIVEQGVPANVDVYLDNQKIGTAPFKLKINKYMVQHGSKLEFRKEGYQTDTVTILRKVHPWYAIADLLTAGVGFAVDAANGAIFRPRPNKFEYSLKKQ